MELVDRVVLEFNLMVLLLIILLLMLVLKPLYDNLRLQRICIIQILHLRLHL